MLQRINSIEVNVKKGMSNMGFDIGQSQTPIISVMAGESKTAMELS